MIGQAILSPEINATVWTLKCQSTIVKTIKMKLESMMCVKLSITTFTFKRRPGAMDQGQVLVDNFFGLENRSAKDTIKFEMNLSLMMK